MPSPVTYVLLTRNRREVLLRTLTRLRADDPLGEAIVVDNASNDGTDVALRREAPWARHLMRPNNEGSRARNVGIEAATHAIVVLLDDDSHPDPGTVAAGAAHLEANADVAVVGGRVHLPDGTEDAAAFPIILPACAWIARREALLDVGGFSDDLFIRAEEYDLILRLLEAGYRVDRFEDLVFRHEKVRVSRSPGNIARLDLTNNLILAEKFLVPPLRDAFSHEWRTRYEALARFSGADEMIAPAIADAQAWMRAHPEGPPHRRPLSERTLETFFGFAAQRNRIAAWAASNDIKRVALAGYSKNMHTTMRSCDEARIDILSIGEDHPAFRGVRCGAHAIESIDEMLSRDAEGVILCTINPAVVPRQLERLCEATSRPILTLWEPKFLSSPVESR